MSAKRYRCAIYCRKSTEEGLDKEFNSLDAQREGCAAYIRSQAGEGWELLPQQYNDGGYTGANTNRPALQRLLAEVDAGRVDVVVVYKIDRLTRSLADFAKIVERFDARGISFVSITQSFNTTTSMGRLTLNVLLSFAQFEREVTAERIRDKIAASRAKGMWMGGGIPLGYDVKGRKLVVNEDEAATIRFIFERYLKVGSIGDLREELDRKRITTKARVSSKGRKSGGGRWYVGPLQHLLRNRLYTGDVVHKGSVYAGEHKAIISRKVFERVQAKLDASRTSWQRKRTVEASGLLTGLIKDDRGNAMTPQWSVGRGGTRHLYYVSQAHLQRRREEAGSLPRLPASIVEGLAVECFATLAAMAEAGHGKGRQAPESAALADDVDRDEVRKRLLRVTVFEKAAEIEFRAPTQSRIRVQETSANIEVKSWSIAKSPEGIVFTLPLVPRSRNGARLEGGNSASWSTTKRTPDRRLISALVRSHQLKARIEAGEIKTVEALGRLANSNRNAARSLLRLSLLAPDIQAAIFQGRQPPGLSAKSIVQLDPSHTWRRHHMRLGMAADS